jgi:AAA domain
VLLTVDEGLSQKVLRYFMEFLQTDFKKQQAPRRRIILKSDAGFRMGLPLRKYVTLFRDVWKFAERATGEGLQFKIRPSGYTAPISAILRDLIRQQTQAISDTDIAGITSATVEYAERRRGEAAQLPEKFIDDVQTQFVEQVGTRIVRRLLEMLESSFKSTSYSAVESIYDVEADLTDTIAARALENLPAAVNSLIVSGNIAPMKATLAEFLAAEDVRARITEFFEGFATSDAFQEMRDLHHSLRSTENQALYLYLCEIKFGPHAFPLFYIPATLEYREDSRDFLLDFDPHLLVNKQAVDWILQERKTSATVVRTSPLTDRIIYLDERASFLDAAQGVIAKLLPSFEFVADLKLGSPTLQQVSSPEVKVSNAAYIAIFDRSDESIVNDYEELLRAFTTEPTGAARLFHNIIQGFFTENPRSFTEAVDQEWGALDVPARLVADTPIPVNEEQRKILTAIKNPDCNYISVQGPPGTGKSHTITAIAFDAILSKQSVLVLSDKTEALDVVQDKLESVLSKVRQGEEDFPNPILRLGRTGNTFNRLVTQSAKEKIKRHHVAAKQHSARVRQEAIESSAKLRSDIGLMIETLSEISLDDLDELHRLEAEIRATRPGLVEILQRPQSGAVATLASEAGRIDQSRAAEILGKVRAEPGTETLSGLASGLAAWRSAALLAGEAVAREHLAVFTELRSNDLPLLQKFLAEYEGLRMPLFGFLFRKKKVRDVDLRLGAAFPCPNPIDLHKRLNEVRAATKTLGAIRSALDGREGAAHSAFAYRLLRDSDAANDGVVGVLSLVQGLAAAAGGADRADGAFKASEFRSAPELLAALLKAWRYAELWRAVSDRMARLPKTDYVGTKTRLEHLNIGRMTSEIDGRFIAFVEDKKQTVKEIGGVIKGKQKFPEGEFYHLSEAFPIVIAGIREYAEYVPLKQRLFDLVVIDEASQVSVAQALPAVLRAKKVVVFGDAKQFSNVKSSQASNVINAGYLTDIEAYFRSQVSDAVNKLYLLRQFDVKKSILEFFEVIANYETMLRKHFRGYQELISFSSKYFYDGQLQAIKIRSRPLRATIRFEVLDSPDESQVKNTNRKEAEFILRELRKMVEEDDVVSVGVITPFREQVKLLNDVLFRDDYGERFESEMHLKIMTFDTCQGEERDLVIFSMVATRERDVLNYVFPTSLDGLADRAEEAIKVQRLNVGFSRAKEAFLFVLSKPVEEFKGSIGRVLAHYKAIIDDRSRAEESTVDPNSPMERNVLDWLYKTPFVQRNEDAIEISPQFPIGKYLKQLDPHYKHPAYRCDFLLRYYNREGPINVVIEYDGFAEHFVERKRIHDGNWDRYYRPEDVERQMVIESYGYKFLRLNRFNLGVDPVATLSDRLYELIDAAANGDAEPALVGEIKGDVAALEEGKKKVCQKCGQVRDLNGFWDRSLKRGQGGYGRICLVCKSAPRASETRAATPRATSNRWRARHSWRYSRP